MNTLTDSLNSMEGLEEPRQRIVPDSMVKCNGKSFRCHCGCNVFHRYTDEPNYYICNACDETYEGS